jgi:endonuclease G
MTRKKRTYDDRKGFDATFLGFSAALPNLTATAPSPAYVLESGGSEFKYHNYSLILSAGRRLAFVSAVNYDHAAPFKVEREGSQDWILDNRVSPQKLQAGNAYYKNENGKINRFDRGHLTRRVDAAWGATLEEAKLGNDDTFHYPNCAPQHELYNQSGDEDEEELGRRLWGNVENHIIEQAAGTPQLSIFNGPIFRVDDRLILDLQVPKEYWKVVAYRAEDGEPRVAAVILSQDKLLRTMRLPRPVRALELGRYKRYQVSLDYLQQRTGLDFSTIEARDTGAVDGRGVTRGDGRPRALGSLDDLEL